MTEFTHLDPEGHVRMVDVGEKRETQRKAVASGAIAMEPQTLDLILDQRVKKGNRFPKLFIGHFYFNFL